MYVRLGAEVLPTEINLDFDRDKPVRFLTGAGMLLMIYFTGSKF